MNSRLLLGAPESFLLPPDTTTNTSRDFGRILGNVYKPGFIDQNTLENTKISIDREFSDISKAFFQMTERMTNIVETLDSLGANVKNNQSSINNISYVIDQTSTDSILVSSIPITNTSDQLLIGVFEFYNLKLTGDISVEVTVINNFDSSFNTLSIESNLPTGNFIPTSGVISLDVGPISDFGADVYVKKISGSGSWSWPNGGVLLSLPNKSI